jgi:circadian clock protein KaiB
MPNKLSKRAALRLRLFVAGDAPNSRTAVANINKICAEHFAAAYEIEIIDVLARPDRTLADGIVVTPTLLKLHPPPAQRVIGNLSDTVQVLLALGGK